MSRPAARETRKLSDVELMVDGTLSIFEAATFLSVSTATLYRMMSEGLPYTIVQRARKIPRRALIEHLAARVVRADRA